MTLRINYLVRNQVAIREAIAGSLRGMENVEENKKNQSPAFGQEKIDMAEKEKQVESLMQLVEEKGIEHAEKVAKKLEDHYVLGRFYEEIAKIEKAKAVAESDSAEEKNKKENSQQQ